MKMKIRSSSFLGSFLLNITVLLTLNVSGCSCYNWFVFGDSLVDAGNNNYLTTFSRANFPPYGIDFKPSGGKPTGRFTNGCTILDSVAQVLGAKSFPPPYLAQINKKPSNIILGGINYASGSSGILDATGSIYIGRIPLRGQINYFEQSRAKVVKMYGEKNAMKYLKRAIFTLTIGSNDIINYFEPNVPFFGQERVPPSRFQDIMVSNLTIQLKRLHKLGARKFILVGVGPLGCIPVIRVTHLVPSGQCAEEVNALIQGYNKKLIERIDELNREMGPESMFVYANSYNVAQRLFLNYRSYGFENMNDPCCGGYFPPFYCYKSASENVSAVVCQDRDKYIFWDMYHPTQAVNFITAQEFVYGDESVCYPINIYQLLQL